MLINHRGHILSQPQLYAITPVQRESMSGRFMRRKSLLKAMDRALKEANCPVPENGDNEGRANE